MLISCSSGWPEDSGPRSQAQTCATMTKPDSRCVVYQDKRECVRGLWHALHCTCTQLKEPTNMCVAARSEQTLHSCSVEAYVLRRTAVASRHRTALRPCVSRAASYPCCPAPASWALFNLR